MKAAPDDLARRRPVWAALSDLFLDMELDDAFYRPTAYAVVESGYTPAEVHQILWGEVFPALEANLRHPAGVWEGFNVDGVQARILGGGGETADQQPGVAKAIREAWAGVCRFLPDEFK